MLLSEKSFAHRVFRDIENIDWSRACTPRGSYALAGILVPWFAAAALLFFALGLYLGFFVAPADARQGEAYRIIFLHVPAAWMSMLIYLMLAVCAGVGLMSNARLPAMMAHALAPTGALFAFLALWTGCLWAKPIWGTWWVWDTRQFSQLILLFLYIGFIALQAAIDDPALADKAGALLSMAGIVTIPINVLSAQWGTSPDQGGSVSLTGTPGMALSMLTGMLAVAVGFWLYSCAVALLRLRCVILERERHSDWVATRGRAAS